MAILLAIPFYKAIEQIVTNFLIFWPHSNIFAKIFNILVKLVYAFADLLFSKINRPANRLVRTNTLILYLIKCFDNIDNKSFPT